jgi:hypothetical protein
LASVVVAATAERQLRWLIETHSLPASTPERVRGALAVVARFPSFGAPLTGRWTGSRFILGPWRWMLLVYRYDEELDRVEVYAVQDARSARAATSLG